MKKSIGGILVVASSLFASQALANAGVDRVGNGGDAIVCQQADGTSQTSFFDFWLARDLGKTLDLGPASLTVQEKVQRVLDRVARVNPSMADSLSADAQVILDALNAFATTGRGTNQVLFTDRELADMPDSDHLILPPGCALKQLAIRVTPGHAYELPATTEYVIQELVFKALQSADDVAGLVLHEAFFKHSMTQLAQTNARTARWMTIEFSLATAERAPFATLLPIFLQGGIDQIETSEFKIQLSTVQPVAGGNYRAVGDVPSLEYCTSCRNRNGRHGDNLGFIFYNVVFDRSGRLNVEETRAANMRPVTFGRPDGYLAGNYGRSSAEVVMTMTIGDRVCTVYSTRYAMSSDMCRMQIPAGRHVVNFQITTDSRRDFSVSSLDYWIWVRGENGVGHSMHEQMELRGVNIDRNRPHHGRLEIVIP